MTNRITDMYSIPARNIHRNHMLGMSYKVHF